MKGKKIERKKRIKEKQKEKKKEKKRKEKKRKERKKEKLLFKDSMDWHTSQPRSHFWTSSNSDFSSENGMVHFYP